jgi:hypothetical protein
LKLVALVLALSIPWATDAGACSVVAEAGAPGPTLAQKASAVETIIRAHVVAVEELPAPGTQNNEPFPPRLAVRFESGEALKGSVATSGTVYVTRSSCGPPQPEVGWDYVLSLYRRPDSRQVIISAFYERNPSPDTIRTIKAAVAADAPRSTTGT